MFVKNIFISVSSLVCAQQFFWIQNKPSDTVFIEVSFTGSQELRQRWVASFSPSWREGTLSSAEHLRCAEKGKSQCLYFHPFQDCKHSKIA